MDDASPAGTALGVLPGNAGYLLSRVGAAVQGGFKDVLARWELRPLQFAILTALHGGGRASQQELCQTLGIDSGNMVELVDGLEAAGYARRERDPRDRRRYQLTITEPGREAFRRIGGAVDDYTGRFLRPLSPPELAGLVAALGKLYAATPEGRRLPPRLGPQTTDKHGR